MILKFENSTCLECRLRIKLENTSRQFEVVEMYGLKDEQATDDNVFYMHLFS